MNNRERILAVLNYHDYDHLPVLHFGFWPETLQQWADEGHLNADVAAGWADGNPADAIISGILGFDGNYYSCFHPDTGLRPAFEREVVRSFPDGSKHILES